MGDTRDIDPRFEEGPDVGKSRLDSRELAVIGEVIVMASFSAGAPCDLLGSAQADSRVEGSVGKRGEIELDADWPADAWVGWDCAMLHFDVALNKVVEARN